jgi:glycosyltransferase involved in cell wall biosynthesis
LTSLRPNQTGVLHNGLNYPYRPLPGADVEHRFRAVAGRLAGHSPPRRINRRFILHVGGNQWYKNRLGVLQVYARLHQIVASAPSLLMVGKPFTREMRQFVVANGLQDCVTELTHAPNQDLHTLYCAAELLFFPSLEEGFGWPIIEALACGCRVVTTNRQPMTEIGGEAAAYTGVPDPADFGQVADSMVMADEAARAIASMLSESPAQRRARAEKGMQQAARFSTAAMVDGYVEVYRQMLNPGVAHSQWRLEPELVR